MSTGRLGDWRARAADVRRDAYVLYLACRDPRTPWYVRLLALAIVAYALSPIDLIPDFIPVLGYVDDLFIVAGGLLLVRKLIPAAVLAEHRRSAEGAFNGNPAVRWAGVLLIVGLWLLAIAVTVRLLV